MAAPRAQRWRWGVVGIVVATMAYWFWTHRESAEGEGASAEPQPVIAAADSGAAPRTHTRFGRGKDAGATPSATPSDGSDESEARDQ